MRYLLGLFLIFAGFMITWKSEWLFDNFGTIPFFEKHLHTAGGGRMGYKLFGVLFIFVGILTLTGLHEKVLSGIASLLVPGA